MPELIAPTARLHAAWLDAHAEWGPGTHEDGFGLGPWDDVASEAGFAAWVSRRADAPGPPVTADQPAPEGAGDAPGCTRRWNRWIVENGRVLGGITLRHGGSDYARWAGNIGYGIRPSERRRGLATWAVCRTLDEARAQGLDRLLAVCAVGNEASGRTLERCGGVFESIQDTAFGPVRRYWITLHEPS